MNEDPGNKEGAIEDIVFEGLGFSRSPSLAHPVFLQAGKRTAHDMYLNSKRFPFEFTAVMLQADVSECKTLFDQQYQRQELSQLGKDHVFVEAVRNGNGLTVIIPKSRFEMTEEEVQADLHATDSKHFQHKFLLTEEDIAWENLRVAKTVKDELMRLDPTQSYAGYSSTNPHGASHVNTDHTAYNRVDGSS